jgi:GNAT superfamily N-acetyltransferase
MWDGYCGFYEAAVSAPVTAHTWRRLVAGDSAIGSLIAVSPAKRALGFANYVVHPYTWGVQSCCYLEDLFVRPDVRGNGVGRALIEGLLALCERERWSHLYWMTRENNAAARRLYDRFAARDDFVRYTVVLGDRAQNDGPADV